MTSEVRKHPTGRPALHSLGTQPQQGGNFTLNVPKGTVTVSLDHVGDWTITVGLQAGTEKTARSMEGLLKIGFFQAAESEGITYLLWTTAFEASPDPRGLTERVLSEALRTIQDSPGSRYIS